MVGLRRGDENIQTFDVRGSAFDSSANGEYIVVGGKEFENYDYLNMTSMVYSSHSLVNSEQNASIIRARACYSRNRLLTVILQGSPSTSWLRTRTNRHLVKLLRIHSIRQNVFACVAGQNVDIYEMAKNCSVQRIISFPAHARKISDFNWCLHNENLLVCCADHDTISLWDLRETSKPCLELDLIFGASQAKFAPFFPDILMSTHGCDMRLWDLRRTVQPINQFTGHEFRIQCLQWHPQEQNIFATSGIDGFLKLWDLSDQKCVPKILSVGSVNAWRMMFSPDGDELASVSLPSSSNGGSVVNVFSNAVMESPKPLKNDVGDVILDICWQKQIQKSTKYLYTLTKRNRLCRHPVAYELSNEVRDEMATPIAQSAVDEERDRLIAEHADEAAAAAAAAAAAFDESSAILFGGTDEEDCAGIDVTKKICVASQRPSSSLHSDKKFLSNSQLNSVGLATNRPTKPSIGISFDSTSSPQNPALKLASTTQTTNTPQSPIVSEWSRWITAPNKTGGDLLTELEAIRKPLTEGIYTTEVNFQRAAIGFSYMHWNKCRKINFEMRFHKFFIENGLVFVEVLQKDSPLTPEKATLFLTLLQQESDEQAKVVSDSTILSRVFMQLPKLVESMKIFTSSIDVPNAGNKDESCSLMTSFDHETDGVSAGDSSADWTAGVGATSLGSTKPATIDPVIYTPSPYDLAVPIPRNCGARFNGSGFLVTFGSRANYGSGITPSITLGRVPRVSKSSLSELEKQQQANASASSNTAGAEYVTFNPYRRRSFQHQSSGITSAMRRGGESPFTASKSRDDHRARCHRHIPSSSSSEVLRLMSSALVADAAEVVGRQPFFSHARHHAQQRTRGGVIASGKPLNGSSGGGKRAHTVNSGLGSHYQRRYRHNVQNSSTTSTTSNLCFGIPRSLADYCILVPPATMPQQQLNVNAVAMFPTKKVAPTADINSSSAIADSLNSLSDAIITENYGKRRISNNYDEDTSNRHSSMNSCSTSPASSTNMFSSSANTVVALNLHPTAHTQAIIPVSSSNATTPFSIVTAATTITTDTFVVSQPMTISAASGVVNALHRNSSIKFATKVLSSSPSACGICSPSAGGIGAGSGSVGSTTRTFSLQNVAHTARNRGNSMTIGAVIGGGGINNDLPLAGIVGSAGSGFPASVGSVNTTNAHIMEEQAVMPELNFCSTVFIYDALGFLPVSKELASEYKLLGRSALELCRYNLKRVQSTGNRLDLVRMWKLLEQCIVSSINEKLSMPDAYFHRNSSGMFGSIYSNAHLNPSLRRSFNRTPWSLHPLGRGLVNNLLDHYYRSNDIQTAAVIACVLGDRRRQNTRQRDSQVRSSASYANNLAALGAAAAATPRYKSSIAGMATAPIPAAVDGAFGTGASGSVHSRSLSASLAPSALSGSMQGVVRTTTDPYNPYIQLSQRERQSRLNSSPVTGNVIQHQSSGNNEIAEYSKLARSSSFENDGPPLMISSGSEIQSSLCNTGGAATGPPSRKTSNSIGLTPTLPFVGMLRKIDPISTYSMASATSAAAVAASSTTVELADAMSTVATLPASSKEQSPLQQQNFRQSRSMNFSKSLYVNSTRTTTVSQPNNLDYYYDFDKEDSANELLLDPKLAHRFEDVRLQYADMLYRWGMYLKCTEVLKYCITPPTVSAVSSSAIFSSNDEIIGLISEISWCNGCDEQLRHTYKCTTCKRPPLNCAVCEEPCYGTVVTCTICAHGGHLSHMARWFDAQTTCPLNCGCECRV